MATTKAEKPKATTTKAAAPKKVAAPKAAVAKKPAAEKKPAAPKKATAPKKAAAPKKTKAGPEERYRMIEVAAYFIAERDGFGGSPVDYWIAAEKQISKLLAK